MPLTNDPRHDSISDTRPKAWFSRLRRRGVLVLAVVGIAAVVAGLLSAAPSTAQAVQSPHLASAGHVAVKPATPNSPRVLLQLGNQVRECSGSATGNFASAVSTGSAANNSITLNGTLDECDIESGPAYTTGGTYALNASGSVSCEKPSSLTGSGTITWKLDGKVDKIGTSTKQDGEGDASDNDIAGIADASVNSGPDTLGTVQLSFIPSASEIANCQAGNFTQVTGKITLVFYSAV